MGYGHCARRRRIAALGGGFACLLGAASGGVPAHAMTVEAFSQSAAAAAYRDGRYDAALAEIDKLLQREPGDSILLRVRGMALYRLGRLEAAETALASAAVAAPNDPAAH